MGVPAFFKWLSKKYPSIVVPCVTEKSRNVDGTTVPIDVGLPNPNGFEFDNLYVDMNGIIHSSCKPEAGPAPRDEEEMMVSMCAYVDRLVAVVRPRRLLYMAIDGVAPRAKQNQKRARKFRSMKQNRERYEEALKIRSNLESRGLQVPPEKPAAEQFDKNCISPGTEFMSRASDFLRQHIEQKLSTAPGWVDLMVILSDASVPGEGEHKIVDYIRRQRAQPDHDPDTHHCLYGSDADLIMLGLATHEVNVTILREEFAFIYEPCPVCGMKGHEMKECQGIVEQKNDPVDEIAKSPEFIFVRLAFLREYLHRDLIVPGVPFTQDMERAIDDWILLCFFVGNDFLPQLPSLEVHEGAVAKLLRIYQRVLSQMGGYISDRGNVNRARLQLVFTCLAETEDEIFKSRRDYDVNYRRNKAKKQIMGERWSNNASYWVGDCRNKTSARGDVRENDAASEFSQGVYGWRQQSRSFSTRETSKNVSRKTMDDTIEQNLNAVEEGESDGGPQDEIRLWEKGFKDRYYKIKFGSGPENTDFRRRVAIDYVQGVCWLFKYYYQGCVSWDWYFPHHYAPFASDFLNIDYLDATFAKGTKPLQPLEQLMMVLPTGSKQLLPPTWQDLMNNSESPIFDFYPVDFRIDLNGKRFASESVVLLPFIETDRLLDSLGEVYKYLTEDEKKRNEFGSDQMFVSHRHLAYDFFSSVYEWEMPFKKVQIEPKQTKGECGLVWYDGFSSNVVLPIPSASECVDNHNQVICVLFENPQYDSSHIFSSQLIADANVSQVALKLENSSQPSFHHSYAAAASHNVRYTAGRGITYNAVSSPERTSDLHHGAYGRDFCVERNNGGRGGFAENRRGGYAERGRGYNDKRGRGNQTRKEGGGHAERGGNNVGDAGDDIGLPRSSQPWRRGMSSQGNAQDSNRGPASLGGRRSGSKR